MNVLVDVLKGKDISWYGKSNVFNNRSEIFVIMNRETLIIAFHFFDFTVRFYDFPSFLPLLNIMSVHDQNFFLNADSCNVSGIVCMFDHQSFFLFESKSKNQIRYLNKNLFSPHMTDPFVSS